MKRFGYVSVNFCALVSCSKKTGWDSSMILTLKLMASMTWDSAGFGWYSIHAGDLSLNWIITFTRSGSMDVLGLKSVCRSQVERIMLVLHV